MANRFWVGGTGDWTDTAHWSDTSGGSGGASYPTYNTYDHAYVDSNSGSGTLTKDTNTALSYFTLNNPNMTLSLDYQMSATFYLYQGVFNTNGNTIVGRLFLTDTDGIRSINLEDSDISFENWKILNITNLTFDAGTSSITSSGFIGGGLTYYLLTLEPEPDTYIVGFISGSNTFTNLTISSSVASSKFIFKYGTTQTITSTFTVSQPANKRILLRTGYSDYFENTTTSSISNNITNTRGSQATISTPTTILAEVDFMDIIGTGGGSWAGTHLGDGQNNDGISFDSPVTRYWINDSGTWSDTAHWSISSGGGSGASVPLCHDTAIFDASSFTTTNRIVRIYSLVLGPTDWSLATSKHPYLYDNGDVGFSCVYILGSQDFTGLLAAPFSNDQYTFYHPIYFTDINDVTLKMYQHYDNRDIYVDTFNGSLTILNDIDFSLFFLISGTFNANNFNVNLRLFYSNLPNIRTLNMGSGTWTIAYSSQSGDTPEDWCMWNTNDITNLTFNADTSTLIVNLTPATAYNNFNFYAGGLTFYNLETISTYSSSYFYYFRMFGNNTFNNFSFDYVNVGMYEARYLILEDGSTQTINGTFSLKGIENYPIYLTSKTGGVKSFISANNFDISYVDVKDNHALGLGILAENFPGGIDSGGNINWCFTEGCHVDPVPYSKDQTTFLVASNSEGDVQLVNVGTKDDVIPIYYELETQDIEMGNKFHNKQISNRMAIYSKNAFDSHFQCKADDDDYKNIDIRMKDRINISNSIGFNGKKFNFKWFGQTKNELPVFEGFRVEDITDFGIIK